MDTTNLVRFNLQERLAKEERKRLVDYEDFSMISIKKGLKPKVMVQLTQIWDSLMCFWEKLKEGFILGVVDRENRGFGKSLDKELSDKGILQKNWVSLEKTL